MRDLNNELQRQRPDNVELTLLPAFVPLGSIGIRDVDSARLLEVGSKGQASKDMVTRCPGFLRFLRMPVSKQSGRQRDSSLQFERAVNPSFDGERPSDFWDHDFRD